MKKSITYILFIGLLASLSLGFTSTDQHDHKDEVSGIQWMTVTQAEEALKKEPRKMFIDVYTSWCGWCKVMDRNTFSDQEVIDYVNKNYYAIKLNAESDNAISYQGKPGTERDFARALQVGSFPTIVLVNEAFDSFNRVPGYKKPGEFKKMLMQFNEEPPSSN